MTDFPMEVCLLPIAPEGMGQMAETGEVGSREKSIMVRAALTEWTPEQEEDSGTVSNGHLTHFGCDLTQGLDSLESPSVACIPLACGC